MPIPKPACGGITCRWRCTIPRRVGWPAWPSAQAKRKDRSRSTQCQVSVPEPTDTGWSQSFSTINNQSAKVPVWWFAMHAISRAITGASVAAIPCGTDLRQIRMDSDATRIDDPVLAQEVSDFTRDCYGPDRAKLFMTRPSLSEEQMHDVT